ncbi:MAG: macro domain-containing protein [Capsulimonadales bacterium]|nr:macro domain-containing protein [Capsulimonadales bacterium]
MTKGTGVRDRVRLVRGNIAALPLEAIVTAANSALMGGGGVDGAVHRAAGPELQAALHAYDGCPEGDAVRTPGFHLPAKWVIHAVGPIYVNGSFGEAEILESAYRRSLAVAEEAHVRTIAFPCIGTGAFRYPRPEAARIAIDTVTAWLTEHPLPETVWFCVFDPEDVVLYGTLLEMTPVSVESVSSP